MSQSKSGQGSGQGREAKARDPEILESQWLAQREALEVLRKSKATLNRLVQDGLIQKRLDKREGRKPEPLYSREDVQKLAQQAESREVALIPKRNSELAIAQTTLMAIGSSIDSLMSRWSDERMAQEKLWLTVREAAEYSGIPQVYLRELAEAGKLGARRFGRRLLIRRANLKDYKG